MYLISIVHDFGSDAGAAESSRGPRRGVQAVDHLPAPANHRRQDRLRNAHTTNYFKWRITGVEQDDLDLTPVVLIDRSGTVRQDDAVTQSQAGAWPDLQLVAGW